MNTEIMLDDDGFSKEGLSTSAHLDPISAEVNVGVERKMNPCTLKRHWFTAKTLLGSINIGVKAYDEKTWKLNQSRQCLDAACALGREENNIQWLENWLLTPLELIPLSEELEESEVYFSLQQIHKNEDNPSSLVVSMSFEVFSHLIQPSKVLLSQVKLQWQILSCNVVLSELSLSSEHLNRLEKDGMLLLPNTFSENWWCLVVPQIDGFNHHFDFQLISSPWSLQHLTDNKEFNSIALDSQNTLQEFSIKVEFDRAFIIGLDALVGWCDDALLLTNALNEVSLHQLPDVVILKANIPFARGSLLSVGDGFGVLITEMVEQ